MVILKILLTGFGVIFVVFVFGLIRSEYRVNRVRMSWLKEKNYQVPDSFVPGKDVHGFKATKLKPKDEIWFYASPPETWARLCGRSGLALVRNGRIIRTARGLIN